LQKSLRREDLRTLIVLIYAPPRPS